MSTKAPFLIAAAVGAALGMATLPAAAATDAKSPVRGVVMFWLLDRNGDGTIDQEEIASLRGAVFDVLDVNGDGTLTREELKEVTTRARAHIADKLADAIKSGPSKGLERREKLLAKLGLLDADSITRADFVGKETTLFAKADTNSDGHISKDEFTAAASGLHGALTPDQ